MRPVSKIQNPLEFPLNHVLGRESHVRILRLMTDQIEPIGVTLIADTVGLTKAGARKAVGSLLKSGIIQEYGSERQRQYSLRSGDGLPVAIISLFEAERKQFSRLGTRIRASVDALTVFPRSVWMENRIHDNPMVLEIGFWSAVRDVATIKSSLRKALYAVEAEFNLTIELEGYTDAELPVMHADNVSLVFGHLPENESERQQSTLSHRDVDQRADVWARQLTRLVRNDPTLVTRATRWLENRLAEGVGTATQDLDEWLNILKTYSKQQLLQFLVSESSRSHRLRQSSPFPAVLDREQIALLNKSGEDG